jgi:3-O-alpha-D-mannopyranosyl-alpha-D-mannopyranose xylosylphosphotransferase
MLVDPNQTDSVFKAIDRNPRVSILGLNDNINSGYDLVADRMGEWFESRWGQKAAWERH